jgi:hypothetical protein
VKRLFLLIVLYGSLAVAARERLELALVNSFPEVRVDGRPFFIHSAAFFYCRIPADRWEPFLRRYREMGINTLDLYVPWNWHEPAEGQLDFDGRTGPRRNIKRVLQLAEKLGFKVILRPGPVILNEWKHGGYPEWLLERPEYNMPLVDRLEGRYAPMSNLAPRNSEEASRGWLENATHMKYARRWLEAVARELVVPHSARHGGAILFLQLDDDQALGRSNYNGPIFWRYMRELRRMLAAGGADLPVFINPTDMRVSAAGWDPSFEKPIAAMGQWYQPAARPEAAGNVPGMPLAVSDFDEIEFFTETLKTQPGFPAMIIEFQAGWYCPAYDIAPRASDPANTLLAARALFENGLKGLNYFPLQDTVYPAGYEVPWSNRHYTWEAALRGDGSDGPKAAAVRRNGRLIEGLGAQLAAAHKWADVGLLYPLGAYPQEKLRTADIQHISGAAITLQRALRRAGFSAEYIDPQYASLEQLKRYRALIMPADEKFEISGRAARLLSQATAAGVPLVAYPDARAGIEPPATLAASLEEAIGKLEAAGVRKIVQGASPDVLVSTQVSNQRGSGAYAFVFATNPDYQNARRVKLSVLDPRSESRRIDIPEFTLRAKDSVALPIRLPLCEATASLQPPASSLACQEELVYATGELTGFRRLGSRVELTFYAPEQIEARLRLQRARERGASRVEATQEFTLKIPAGDAPEYARTLTVSLQPSGGRLAEPPRLPKAVAPPVSRPAGASSPFPAPAMRKAKTVGWEELFDSGEQKCFLENERLRVVISPGSGGRAFEIIDKSTGQNLTTTVGAFRDRFSYYEQAPGASRLRLRGAFGLHNRPYRFSFDGIGGLQMRYDADEVLPAGARIFKRFSLPDGRDYLRADYEVILREPSPRQQFISVHSLPYQDFEQGSNWVAAFGNNHIAAIAWEGEAGQATVERQAKSALLNIKFPPLDGALAEQRFRIAWRAASGPPATARQIGEQLAGYLK